MLHYKINCSNRIQAARKDEHGPIYIKNSLKNGFCRSILFLCDNLVNGNKIQMNKKGENKWKLQESNLMYWRF